MSRSIFRTVVTCAASAALLTAQMLPASGQTSVQVAQSNAIPSGHAGSASTLQAVVISRAEYEACQARDEAGFKTAIEALTQKALTRGLTSVDYKSVVAAEWRRGNLDDVIEKRVDQAMAEVRDETSWGNLLQSLAYKEKAQELATAVAERVYKSEAIGNAIESLAVGVGAQIGRTIELATVDAGEPALACMQAFLGPRYGATIARVVAKDAGRQFTIDPGQGRAAVSTGAVLAEGREGLAGSIVLLVRRQLSNMAGRIGQRIVGALVGRLVAVVAGGVGVVLIAKDIWDFRYGVLPIIASEMKSSETKEKVREELVKTISEQIGEHTREISAKTAERVVEIWQEFRRAHAKVLELAERSDPFKRFLDAQKPENLPRLDEMVAIVLASEGEAGVLKRLDDGTLHQAVSSLPPEALAIAREARSLETALHWSALAGEALPKVVEHEIHRRATPQDFSKAALTRVLALGDRLAITRLASIKRATREILFEVDDGDLRRLGRGLTEGDLETLASYMTGLEKGAGQRVLRVVAHTPIRMQALAPPRVRAAVLASRDQTAAVNMMLRSASGLDPSTVAADFDLVWKGHVSAILLWEKQPEAVGILALSAFFVLMLLKRLLFGRRRRGMSVGAGR